VSRLTEIIAAWRERREQEDWRRRRGRFKGLERDTPDRPQVRPVPEPPVERQTHRPGHGA
jgi:hypothetical protein